MTVFERILTGFAMENAFYDWQDYRGRLTAHILAGEERAHMKKLAVIGAGRCCDLDLRELRARYGHVTLVDYDRDAMEEGLRLYGLREGGRLVLREATLTGITLPDVQDFCDRLLAGDAPLSAWGPLREKLYASAEEFRDFLAPREFDTVVCAGVHSQLFSLLSYTAHVLCDAADATGEPQDSFAEACAADAAGEPQDGPTEAYAADGRGRQQEGAAALDEALREASRDLVPLLNTALLGAAKERVLFGCEYDEAHPVEGAYRCIGDIRARGLEYSERHIPWIFDLSAGRLYDVLVQEVFPWTEEADMRG